MLKELKLRILLQNPVDGTMYGLQKGKGPDYETVQAQPGNGSDITFDFVVELKQGKDGTLSPGGPFVQGTVSNRFVYIGVGKYAGQTEAIWSGRIKVPLFEPDLQKTGSNDSDYCWSCKITGRTADGKPVFATVKPFSGWFLCELAK